MILILDTSGSMSQKVKVSKINDNGQEILVTVERLQVMKEAALALLETITFVDFVQIVHVEQVHRDDLRIGEFGAPPRGIVPIHGLRRPQRSRLL